MGKCVSKHPSAVTLALSDKDLARANQIWSKFAESSEYIAVRNGYGNQLCEYYYVSNKAGDTINYSHEQQKQQQEQQLQLEYHQQHGHHLQQLQHEQFKQQFEPKTNIKSDVDDDDDDDDLNADDTKNDDVAATSYDEDETQVPMPMAKTATMMVAPTPTIVLLEAQIDDVDDMEKKKTTIQTKKKNKKKDTALRLEQHKTQAKQDTSRQYRHIVGNNANKQWYNSNNNKNNDLPQYCCLQGFEEQKQQQQQQKPQQQLLEAIDDDSNNEMVNIRKSRYNNNNNNNDFQPVTALHEKSEKSNLKYKHHQNCILETVGGVNDEIDIEHNNNRHIDDQHQEDICESEIYFGIWTDELGQSESKKLFKKHTGGGGSGGLETKGTAMSFGFRKKLNTTPKKTKKQKEHDSGKKQDKCNNLSADSDGVSRSMVDEIRTRCGVGRGGTVIDTQSMESFVEANDNNGNTEQMANVHFEKVGAAVAAKTAQSHNQGASLIGEQLQQQQQHRPGAGNRFGFKGNSIVRPASTGITPRYQSGDELLQANLENNNMDNAGEPNKNLPYKSNLKRRSKSAHSARSMTSNQCGDAEFEDGCEFTDKQTAGAPKITQPKTITFNLNHNTIEYQRRQFFEQTPTYSAATTTSAASTTAHYNIVNTGRHTNVIVRPLPRPAPVPATFTKFTLQTTSLPKPEYPVPIRLTTVHAATAAMPLTVATAYPVVASTTGARAKDSQVEHMDQKTAKQMANNTRRGFNGSREISADSGIASLDITLGGDSSTSSGGGGVGHTRHSSPKRSRSRPRNLQMVMSGRHKFEVRDLDDNLSSESSLVETLALPKLPSEHQTVPLPLSGLVRSNTVLSREAFMQSSSGSAAGGEAGGADGGNRTKRDECDAAKPSTATLREHFMKQTSDDTDSIEEEKLHIDRSTSEKNAKKHHKFHDINTYSSKNSSATSSRASSWCNAGESLAIKDCSSLSISSSEDSNKLEHKYQSKHVQQEHLPDSLNEDDFSTILNTDMQISSISSLTESLPVAHNKVNNNNMENNHNAAKLIVQQKQRPGIATPLELSNERPQSLYSSLNESKFAEMAAAGSEYLLDDETSPTDSLVSSTDSDDAACKRQKHKTNEEIQEKDIDEISPELDLGSPISPGTPTHASHSLSLSDCGNLIDDEIADQPALLFNNDGGCGEHSAASHKGHSDTPTLMETAGGSSMHSLKSQSKARTALQQAIELSLRTPMSLRQAVLNRAESLDTLSPCESICSDDLMMDFDVNSSMDSIDKSTSIKSRSGSDLNKLDESLLFGELDRKGSSVMKELNTILRVHTRNPDKEGVTTNPGYGPDINEYDIN